MHYTDPKVYEFISKQTNEPIVERKTCTISGTKFPIFQSDLDFYDKISPCFEASKEMGDKLIKAKPVYFSWTEDGKLEVKIPTPTLCPEERQRRRLLFRNERKLYKRKCDATGETIISMHSPDKTYTVYDQRVWRSDERNNIMYGQVVDENRSFNDIFTELLYQVPHVSFFGAWNENSPYINCA